MTDYSQKALIQKINLYLSLTNQPVITDPGFCHGYVLKWLKQMAQNKEDSLYNLRKEIIDCPDDKILKIGDKITEIRAQIDKKQHPKKYPKKYPAGTKYSDVDVILRKTEKQICLDGSYSAMELASLFEIKRQGGNMFCITTGFEYMFNGVPGKHTIGMYVRGNVFFLFDPNDLTGKGTGFLMSNEVVSDIQKYFFTEFTLLIPHKLPLEIKLVRYPAPRMLNIPLSPRQDEIILKDEIVPLPKHRDFLTKANSYFNRWTNVFQSSSSRASGDEYSPLIPDSGTRAEHRKKNSSKSHATTDQSKINFRRPT